MNLASGYDPQRSRWIPWVFVGGMGLVLLVNIGLVYSALSTFTGVTVGQAYDRGRAYNHVLAEGARQDALGWRASVTLTGTTLVVTARDGTDQPVAGLLEGVLRRPLEGRDVPLSFTAQGDGVWRLQVPTLPAGQWEARLSLRDASGQHLDIRQRVVLP